MKLKWHHDEGDWVGGPWRIEKVHSDAPKGYGWYVAEPIDGGYYDSLTEAKADCQRASDTAAAEAEQDE